MDRRRELRDKADTEPGGDYRLDPMLALAAEADPKREALLTAALIDVVLVFAIDPGEISLAGDIGDADPVLLAKTMAHRECDAESLAIQRANLKPVAESLRLRHDCEIELAVEEQFRKVSGDAFDECHIAARSVVQNSAKKPIKRTGPTEHISPRLIGALSIRRKRIAVDLAASAWAIICSRCGRTRRPKSVRCVRLFSRRSNSPPSSSSSLCTTRVSAGCETLQYELAVLPLNYAGVDW